MKLQYDVRPALKWVAQADTAPERSITSDEDRLACGKCAPEVGRATAATVCLELWLEETNDPMRNSSLSVDCSVTMAVTSQF